MMNNVIPIVLGTPSEIISAHEMRRATPVFEPFKSIPQISRNCTITEKIDGTNALIHVLEDGRVIAGSRSRYLFHGKTTDNYGFAGWVWEHEEELRKLGPGRHYGEWWGKGIQREYGVTDKRFSLFNSYLWSDSGTRPACCGVVPVIYEGPFSTDAVDNALRGLKVCGSLAAPGYMAPEGVIVWHEAGKCYFKKTLNGDGQWVAILDEAALARIRACMQGEFDLGSVAA